MTALIVVEAVAILLLGVLVAGLLRSHAEILRKLHALGVGLDDAPDVDPAGFRVRDGLPAPGGGAAQAAVPAHDLTGVRPPDEALSVPVVGVQHHTLLAFLSSGCLVCDAFWEAFRAGEAPGLPAGSRLVIVTKGTDAERESAIAELAPSGVPLVMSTTAWEDYAVPGSPYFVYVEAHSGRIIGEGTATAWPQVADLLRQAVADRGQRRGAGTSGRGDADRADRVDRELMAAGIYPGHPSLYGPGEIDERPAGT